jgi:hypothetical protein
MQYKTIIKEYSLLRICCLRDIVRALIYNPQSADFVVKKDSVFASIIFADKNQSHPL